MSTLASPLITALNAAISQAQQQETQISSLQQQLAAAQAQIVQQAAQAQSFRQFGTLVLPGTDIFPLLNAGPAGIYFCPPGVYPCKGTPSLKQNQTWIAPQGAEIDFTPAPEASSAITIYSQSSSFDGFKFVGKPLPGPNPVSPQIRIYGVGLTVGGTPTAAGFPNWYPRGNVIRNCEIDATMGCINIYSGAWGTVIDGNLFHQTHDQGVYNCGYQTLIAHNRFPEGSQFEHCVRDDVDGATQATQTVIAYNWLDNRTSPAKKEDLTLRQGQGNAVVGNAMMGWSSIGEQGSLGASPYGSPSFWLGNIMPGTHGTGALLQADINTTLYFDSNYITGNPQASQVTVYAGGNLVTHNNHEISVPANAKPLYAALPVGATPFNGLCAVLSDPKMPGK